MICCDALKAVNAQLNVKLDEATAEIERLQRLHETALNERDTACEAHETAVQFNRNLVRMRQDSESLLTKAMNLLARVQDGSPKRPREANSHSIQLDYEIGQLLQRAGFVWDAINRQWRPGAQVSPRQAHGTLYQCERVPPDPGEIDLADLAADEAALPWNQDE
jgi:multidrug resistance efflux pump